MEKFTPIDKDLPNFSELELLANVSESDLWDAVNYWLNNNKGEFNKLIQAEINNA